jgi:hypothetical protein
VQLDSELSQWRRKTETKLPPSGNPRAREFALKRRAEAGDDARFLQGLLDTFNREPYVYTLQPGVLSGVDTIDQFLFDTQRGFCEHYASAFVFMARAAGIPARVVAGYQGGEVNPVNKTVIVHQFDAHAWAEVWLEGTGWVQFDPTAAVSPLRIESGLEQAMASEGSFLAAAPLSALRYRNIPLLNMLRLRYDALTYRWQSWVVGYNNEQQFDLLQRFFGEISTRMFATLLLGSWALVLVPVAISLFRKKDTHPTSPMDTSYRLFCQRMARLGLVRDLEETPDQFAQRAADALPGYAARVRDITDMYTTLAYANTQVGDGLYVRTLGKFRRTVARFKPDRRAGVIDDSVRL